MDPLNTQERNSAFMKFILIFVVTMVLVLIAAFFDVVVPRKENRDLIKQNRMLQDQMRAQEQILEKMDSIKVLLIKLDQPNADVTTLDASIASMIIQMQAYENDSTTLGRIMKSVNIAYTGLKNEKLGALKKMGTSDEEIKDLEDKLENAEEDLKDCEKAKNDLLISIGTRN